MSNVLWQPESLYQPGADFKIIVDREFVREMLNTPLSKKGQSAMNDLGYALIKRRGCHWLAPYTFDSDNAFVRQFSLGENGVWLALDGCSGGNPLEHFSTPDPIKYSSHNIEGLNQAHLLMSLVDLWVEYRDTMKGG